MVRHWIQPAWQVGLVHHPDLPSGLGLMHVMHQHTHEELTPLTYA